MSGSSLMGLAIGVAAGLAAGLLAANGSARLQSLASTGRGWAQHAVDRGLMLVEEGRRAFQTSSVPTLAEPQRLTATLGEIAQTHGTPLGMEAGS